MTSEKPWWWDMPCFRCKRPVSRTRYNWCIESRSETTKEVVWLCHVCWGDFIEPPLSRQLVKLMVPESDALPF